MRSEKALISVLEEVDQLHPNLRCFDQRRKYGFEYLYPVQRYVLGLTSPVVIETASSLPSSTTYACWPS